ncbi:MAG: tetratricopeptide repeat protein [Gallionella sp.]|nr:tetratricopeptide repeat protein [Gallionella sp.]
MKKFKQCSLVSILLLAMNGHALANELEDAKQLMQAGKPAQAYQQLSLNVGLHQQDADYLYTAAVAALDSGNASAAVPLFEQVIKLDPDNAGAHLDLGRAYSQLGKRDAARRELQVAQSQNPPTSAGLVIDRYLSALDEQEKNLSGQYHAFLEGGLGYDDNVNNATASSQIAVPLFGNALMTLNPTSVKTRSGYATVSGAVNGVKPLDENTALYGAATLGLRSNFGNSTFDGIAPDVRGGVMYGKDNHFVRGGLFANQYYLKGQHNRDVVGLNGDWYYVMDDHNRIGVFGQYGEYRFASAIANENFNQSLLGGSWSHTFAPGSQLSVALYGGSERAPNRLDGNKDIWAARLSGEHKLNEQLSLTGGVGYQDGRYKKRNVLFLVNRADQQFDLNAGVNYRLDQDWTIRGQYSYLSNRSNIALNNTSRNDLSVVVRREF